MRWLVVILSATIVAGCGEEATSPHNGSSADSSATGPAYDGEEIAWDDKTLNQRVAFMEHVVVPTMAPMFQQFDPQRYEHFDCTTCHGSSAATGNFSMPNPDLYAIDPINFPSANSPDPSIARFTPFMYEVRHAMRTILGGDTGARLSCFSCHPFD